MHLILLSKSEYLQKSALTVQLLVVPGTVFFLEGMRNLYVVSWIKYLDGCKSQVERNIYA